MAKGQNIPSHSPQANQLHRLLREFDRDRRLTYHEVLDQFPVLRNAVPCPCGHGSLKFLDALMVALHLVNDDRWTTTKFAEWGGT